MKHDFIVWEPIFEKRSGYYVEYCPGRTNYPHAHLNVVFTSAMPAEKVAETLEEEFGKWARLYSVALFAAALDEKEDTICLSSVRAGDSLYGYYDPATDKLALYWETMQEAVPERLTQPDHLKAVYSALPIKTTAQECRKNAKAHVKQMRIVKRFLYTWSFLRLFVWPLLKKISLIGTISGLRAYAKSIHEWQLLTGQAKPSQKETEESERKRMEAHWLHHCRLNPEGFARLRAENFEREARERIQKEVARLEII